ncbi:MAG: hypothetical protein K0R57_3878 [Paenibacillaceae bacterium]|jgi:hypothetical protein|nr:hypothetical protein [Paenibacillaceae bacterium]
MNITVRPGQKILLVLLSFILFSGFVAGMPVYAEELSPTQPSSAEGIPASDTRGIREVFYDDRTFLGNSSIQDSYFEIGQGLTAGAGSYLDLYFAHSPTLQPDASTVTLLMDDKPLDSVTLNESNVKETHWRIDLSALGLGPGYHKLTVNAKLTGSDLFCQDPYDPSTWMIVYQKSRIALKLVPNGELLSLSAYPAPFVERGEADPLRTVLIVPDGPTQEEFGAAARLSQFFAAQGSSRTLELPIFTETEITEDRLKGNHLIWLGAADRWKGPGVKALAAAAQSAAEAGAVPASGFISIAASPWEAARTVLALSGNGQELMNAVQILTNEPLYRQLQGKYEAISARLRTVRTEQPAVGQPYEITLRGLGYDNLSLQNALQGSISFQYPIPGGWDLPAGAKLNLAFTHSQSIVFNKSVATVRLNGTPVASVNLTAKTAEGGVLEVPLPPEVIGTNRTLSIEIAFQFINPAATDAMERQFGCSETVLGDWAKIDASSSISFTPAARHQAYLQFLPFPFVVDNAWNAVTMVMKRPDTRHLQLAMTLIGLMGAGNPETGDLKWLTPDAQGWTEQLVDRNAIYIGTTAEMPDELRSYTGSYVLFQPDSIVSQSPEVELLSALQSQSAAMQLTVSPFAGEHRRLLMVTATSEERLNAWNKALTGNESRSKLNGRFVAMDRQDSIYAFAGTQDLQGPYLEQPDNQKNHWSTFQASLPMFTIALVSLLLLAFLALWFNRQKRD